MVGCGSRPACSSYHAEMMLRAVALVPVTLGFAFAGCESAPTVQSGVAAPTASASVGAPAAAALEPLAFMTGAWVLSQANGAIIEEHWMPARGNAMLGSFRRILGNGVTPFYEFTQIVAEKDGVVLRQIHVHADFDTDPKRAKPMQLRLESCSPGRATFVPAGSGANAGALARVTYSSPAAGELLLVVEPRAEEGKPADPPLEFRMRRVG